MALIAPGISRCAICGSNDLTQPYVTTSGVIFPRGHHLWPFCDAPLHIMCVEKWAHRVEFSRGYFEAWRRRERDRLVVERPDWFMSEGPSYMQLILGDWPLRLYASRDDWPVMLAGGFCDGLIGEMREVAERVLEEVRR